MKAVVNHGPRNFVVEDVDDPSIEQPLDAIIRITTANICGSDLHPHEGRAEMDDGMVVGHENLGIVEAGGAAVDRIKVGDRVSVPFNLVVAVYVSEDPGAATDQAAEDRIPFSFGAAFEKGISIGTGQCPVKACNRELRDLVDAVEGYRKFDAREDGWTKVLLHPGQS